jgi:polyisoprenyl-phosphate glycosyltransferase
MTGSPGRSAGSMHTPMPGETRPRGRPLVSVVVPAYRTADTLQPLRVRVGDTLDAAGLPYELIVVDDACPAGSGRAARTMAERDECVRVVTHPVNLGQHRAVVSGMAEARGVWTVALDGDLQDPPEAIPALIARANDGFDIVFAGRRGDYESRGRLRTSRMFKRVLHWLTGVPYDAGLYMLVSRRAARRIVALARGRASVVATAGLCGLPMTSVPVARARRLSGASAYSSFGRVRSAAAAIGWACWGKLAARPVPGEEDGS